MAYFVIMVLECRDMIEDALILMGEVGGNDLNYAFFVGKPIEEIKELIPLVITTISSAITVKKNSLSEYLSSNS